MDQNLHRYWVRMEPDREVRSAKFGVTAYDEADALAIIRHVVFSDGEIPGVLEVRSDVDVRDLDQGHVVPNMGPPNWRGIWYPKGSDPDIR